MPFEGYDKKTQREIDFINFLKYVQRRRRNGLASDSESTELSDFEMALIEQKIQTSLNASSDNE